MSEPTRIPVGPLEHEMEAELSALHLRVEELTHERDQANKRIVLSCHVCGKNCDPSNFEAGKTWCNACEMGALRSERDQARRELGEARQARWIPVEERLPKEDEIVLFLTWIETDDHDGITQRWREVFRGTIYSTPLQIIATADDLCEYESGEVTHWMPLPEPPK